jgi:uncharacterized protein
VSVLVGLMRLDCAIPGSRSLKEKRRAMNSLKERLRSRFNCSVAEVDWKEQWNRARLAVSVVADDSGHLDEQLDEIGRFASTHHLVEVMDMSREHL